jgi:hypothetical protein
MRGGHVLDHPTKMQCKLSPQGSTAIPADLLHFSVPHYSPFSLQIQSTKGFNLVDAGQRVAAPAADMDGAAEALPLAGAAYQPYVSELLSFSIERLHKVRSRVRTLAAPP